MNQRVTPSLEEIRKKWEGLHLQPDMVLTNERIEPTECVVVLRSKHGDRLWYLHQYFYLRGTETSPGRWEVSVDVSGTLDVEDIFKRLGETLTL